MGVCSPVCVVHDSLAREPMLQADDLLPEHLKDRFDHVRTPVCRRSTFSIEEALANMEKTTLTIRRPVTASRRAATSGAGTIGSRVYSDLVGAWFEIESAVLRAHADALVRRAEVERVDDMSLIELARILDSIEWCVTTAWSFL